MTKKILATQTLSVNAFSASPARCGITGTQHVTSAAMHGVKIILPAGYLALPAPPSGQRLAVVWTKAAGAVTTPAVHT